jgi:hypothetical protein
MSGELEEGRMRESLQHHAKSQTTRRAARVKVKVDVKLVWFYSLSVLILTPRNKLPCFWFVSHSSHQPSIYARQISYQMAPMAVAQSVYLNFDPGGIKLGFFGHT